MPHAKMTVSGLWLLNCLMIRYVLLMDISNRKIRLMGGYVLMNDMPYWKHVLRENMSLQRTCVTGGFFFDDIITVRI